ncbi:hypothetical protein NPIL_351491 [Nephila pilipes]|uniref:Uncharacterized protein n=1 Tax=Nephila pilipes TaxID=299642 RepID=A0A8X6PJ66_NEPPI|nr:hypothetical protein NPIL_351491 [Nephila pilipes]
MVFHLHIDTPSEGKTPAFKAEINWRIAARTRRTFPSATRVCRSQSETIKHDEQWALVVSCAIGFDPERDIDAQSSSLFVTINIASYVAGCYIQLYIVNIFDGSCTIN